LPATVDWKDQWKTLARRCLAIKIKDRVNTAILLAQAPVIAILIAGVFGQKSSQSMALDNWPEVATATTTTDFLLVLSALWFGCSNSIREIVSEWAIYQRERMINLRTLPYVASKFAVLGAVCVIQCLVLLFVVYPYNGLQGSWIGMLSILILTSLVGLTIGLLISSVSRTSEVAVTLLPLILLPMVILGGLMHPVHSMGSSMQLVSNMMPSRWAFESIQLLESSERPSRGRFRLYEPESTSWEDGTDMAEEHFPSEDGRSSVLTGMIVLLLMLGGLFHACRVVLRRRDIHATATRSSWLATARNRPKGIGVPNRTAARVRRHES
jgi:hypothetical protein